MPNRQPDDEPQPRSSLDDESADTTPERGTDEPERGLGDLAQRSDDDSDALDLGILEPRPADDGASDTDESEADDTGSDDDGTPTSDDADRRGEDSDGMSGSDGGRADDREDADSQVDRLDDPDGDAGGKAGAPGGGAAEDTGSDIDQSAASDRGEDASDDEPVSDGDDETSGSDDGDSSGNDEGDDDDSSVDSDDNGDDEPSDNDDAGDDEAPDDEASDDGDDADEDAADAEPFEDDGSSPLVKAGPRWYRSQIRRFGPVAALAPMAGFGLIAWLALTLSDSRASGIVGLVAGAAAAPGLLVAGAPFGDSDYYPFVVMASIPFWLALGWLAARRATRRPVMSWRDYVRELVWLALAVVVGVIVALSIASAQLGEPLLS